MTSKGDSRERVRRWSILAYLVMLGALAPMTIFLAQQEQKVQSRASVAVPSTVTPSFYPLAPCPSCVNPTDGGN